ncbi:hypothetical protein [Draconibacterium orientale]|uniref:hypothetical protein n=1 Tax=Draconibacterium orientale TaxID=1168034 RepID=UPI002A0A3750|nr:hypothetical protein [Draconibacterium orientale]
MALRIKIRGLQKQLSSHNQLADRMSQQLKNLQKHFQESGNLYEKVADLSIKKQRQSTLSLFPNLTKSISMKKTLKLFKFYATKIRRILVNAFKRKLKNVISAKSAFF